jgi:hypothetical protein
MDAVEVDGAVGEGGGQVLRSALTRAAPGAPLPAEVTTMHDPRKRDDMTDDAPFIRVECYAGHRAETEPRLLYLGDRAVEVTEIIDRWLDPRHRYFKLRGDDGGIYLIRHDTETGGWELILFDSGQLEETRLSST